MAADRKREIRRRHFIDLDDLPGTQQNMRRTVTDVERYQTMKDLMFDLSCHECASQGVLFMAFLLRENRETDHLYAFM